MLRHGELKKKLLGFVFGLSSLAFAAETPLVQAIFEKEDVVAAKQLLENGADVNERSNAGDLTPLMNAALLRAPGRPDLAVDMVKMLLEYEPDVNAKAILDNTALHFATQENNVRVSTLLVNAGADVNAVNEVGETPLLLATRFNSPADLGLVSLLVAKGAHVGFRDKKGNTALDIWRQERKNGDDNYAAMIKILEDALAAQTGDRVLESGISIREQAACVENRVCLAPLSIDPWDTSRLVQLIKDAKLSDDAIKSFLRQNHSIYDSWRARIAAGEANVISRSHTPLIEAIWQGSDETVIKKLLDLGEDVNYADLNGSTPLMNAAYKGKEKLVSDFIARGADPRASDDNGDTALMFAVEAHVSPAVVQALLKAGTPVNAVNKQGKSALIEAVSLSSIGIDTENLVEAVRLLLASGARVDLKTDFVEYGHFFKTRKTALDYAKESGNPEMIEMLEVADREQAKSRPSMAQRFWRWLEEDMERG